MSDALETTGPNCNPAFTEALTEIQDLISTNAELWPYLTELFKLCEPLDGENGMDVKSFMELVIDNLAGIVQYNGRTSFPLDIFSTCAIMTNETIGAPMKRLAKINEIMLGGEKCADHTYQSFLADLTNTQWTGSGTLSRYILTYTYFYILSLLHRSQNEGCILLDFLVY